MNNQEHNNLINYNINNINTQNTNNENIHQENSNEDDELESTRYQVNYTFFDFQCFSLFKYRYYLFIIYILNLPILFWSILYFTNISIKIPNQSIVYFNVTNLNSFNTKYKFLIFNNSNLFELLLCFQNILIIFSLILKTNLYFAINRIITSNPIRNDRQLINNMHYLLSNYKNVFRIINMCQLIWIVYILKLTYYNSIDNNSQILIFIVIKDLIVELFPIILIFLMLCCNYEMFLNEGFDTSTWRIDGSLSIIELTSFILLNNSIRFIPKRLNQKQKLDLIKKKIKTISINNQNLINQNCIICFEEYQDNSRKKIIELPCSHVFHKTCFLKWAKKNQNCPYCRLELLKI